MLRFYDGDDWYLDGAIDQALKAIEAHSDCDIFFILPQIYYMSDETIHPWYDADKLRRIFSTQDKGLIHAQTHKELFSPSAKLLCQNFSDSVFA